MENLHPDVILDIFSRLPVESVLECKLVCKTWCQTLLLHSHCFADMHLHRQLMKLAHHGNGNVGFLSLVWTSVNGYRLFYGDEKSDHKLCDKNNNLRVITNHPLLNMMSYSMVGSCNGLICFSEYSGNSRRSMPCYIYNPVTKEFINLPRFSITEYDKMVSGFGYLLSTNEYKVVTICYGEKQPLLGQAFVYTLGGGGGGGNGGGRQWRKVGGGDMVYSLENQESCGILVNGALHWVDERFNGRKIVSFNLADEKFSLLDSPPILDITYDRIKLQAVGGWLCVVHDTPRKFKDLWLLKKTENSSSSNFDLKRQDDQYSWHRIREFGGRSLGKFNPSYDSFAITKSGEWVLRHNSLSFHHYSDYDKEILGAIPHMNSFVSLKALGEHNVHTVKLKKR